MASKNYEKGRIAVDAVIFTIYNKKLHVLLHQREKEPFKELHELPGGLIDKDETAEDTLKRKLKETINQERIFFQQYFTFTKPNRDPRERTVSVGFIALVNKEKIKDIKKWYEYSKLPKMAFDHNEIINKARNYLKENINSIIAKQFMPKEFPLNNLQEVYEIIEEVEFDNRNFRKKIISSGIVEDTKKKEVNVSHRPAKLFKFKD